MFYLKKHYIKISKVMYFRFYFPPLLVPGKKVFFVLSVGAQLPPTEFS